MVVVAQLVRASDCGSEGRRFETGHPPRNRPIENRAVFLLSNIKVNWKFVADNGFKMRQD